MTTLRVRPVWIETRVPARITCPHCRLVDQALLRPDSEPDRYEYQCKGCNSVLTLSLDQLNDPALREKIFVH